MDPSHHFAAGGEPPRRPPHPSRNQLHGPRPSPLQVSKTSHTIKKPPLHPPLHHHHHQSQPATAAATTSDDQPPQPTIIYAVSPKVIHVPESEFRSIVQRLTGLSPVTTTATATITGESLSPAARLAFIERTSPTERETTAAAPKDDSDLMMGMLDGLEFLQGPFPSILSPAPATLPGISPAIFSPATDLQNWSFLQEFSSPRFWPGNSPSPLFPGSIVSPGTPVDLFSLFSDFS